MLVEKFYRFMHTWLEVHCLVWHHYDLTTPVYGCMTIGFIDGEHQRRSLSDGRSGFPGIKGINR